MLSVGELGSIVEQLTDGTHQVEVVGENTYGIGQVAGELYLYTLEVLLGVVDALAGYVVA